MARRLGDDIFWGAVLDLADWLYCGRAASEEMHFLRMFMHLKSKSARGRRKLYYAEKLRIYFIKTNGISQNWKRSFYAVEKMK